jgi:trehalose synthase
VDPAALVHALQNHDELTLELVHFWTLHEHDSYTYGGRTWTGGDLRDQIRAEMYARITGPDAPYNLPFVTNGVASTSASIAAAALGIGDLESLTDVDARRIQQGHLLLAMYNALQPGVFALAGWDLVGALPLPRDAVAHLLADGDTRWIHRGAYDLMGVNPAATQSNAGLPRAQTLYGSIPDQLARPDSFVSQLRQILAVRERYQLYAARQVAVPEVQAPGLLVLVHELPAGLGMQVTALNFGQTPVEEAVAIRGTQQGPIYEMLAGVSDGEVTTDGALRVQLAPLSGKSYLLAGKE